MGQECLINYKVHFSEGTSKGLYLDFYTVRRLPLGTEWAAYLKALEEEIHDDAGGDALGIIFTSITPLP